MKEMEATKVEYLMTLNDRIIVQRFFNVRNFNANNRNSIEFNELMSRIIDNIKYDLKMKTVVYMMDNQHIISQNQDVLKTSMTEDSEFFNIYIKIDNMTICHRQFDAKQFPPKIRYTVDLRPTIKNILNQLTDIFSDTELTFDYLGLPMNV